MAKDDFIHGGRPRHFDTPEAMQAAIDAYFRERDSRTAQVITRNGVISIEKPAPYTIQGLCLALGFASRQSFIDYLRYDDGAYSDVIKRAKLKVEENKVSGLIDGTYSAAGTIFDLKNSHEHTDRQELYHDAHIQSKLTDEERAAALAAVLDTARDRAAGRSSK